MASRHHAQATKAKEANQKRRKKSVAMDGSLRANFPLVWEEQSSAAWGNRTSPAWGGIGYQYDLEHGTLEKGWEAPVVGIAKTFDNRHDKLSNDARKLLKESEIEQRKLLDWYLFGLRSNRFNVQPLRLPVTNISPRSSSTRVAMLNYNDQIALAKKGGPLIPVHERMYDERVFDYTAEENLANAQRPRTPPHESVRTTRLLRQKYLTNILEMSKTRILRRKSATRPRTCRQRASFAAAPDS